MIKCAYNYAEINVLFYSKIKLFLIKTCIFFILGDIIFFLHGVNVKLLKQKFWNASKTLQHRLHV